MFVAKTRFMNFLAHIYLSGNNKQLITGNFIGDHIKGKNFLKYPGRIREGIILHRRIDTFTDTHPLAREVRLLFRHEYRLYSGVVTDLVFDHYLAKNWHCFSATSLKHFTHKVHRVLLEHYFYLPPRVKGFLPILIKNRRLESYAQLEGIQESMKIMSRYTSLPDKTDLAIEIMKLESSFIESRFHPFMEELIAFVEQETGLTIKDTACAPNNPK